MAIFKRLRKSTDPNNPERYENYRVCVYMGINKETGKKWYRWGWAKNMPDAKKLESKFYQEKGSYVKPGKLTLANYLDKWLKDYAKPNTSPTTYSGYEHIFNKYTKPMIGKIPLTALTTLQISDYYSDLLNKKLSTQTIKHHHTALHKALDTARMPWHLISVNPADDAFTYKINKPEMQTYNTIEVQKYLETCKSHERFKEYYALFHLDLFTGLRRSELLGLKWTDVDLAFATLTINRSLHFEKEGKWYFRNPKTAKGKRSIKLSPAAVLALLDHYNKTKEVLTQLGKLKKDKTVDDDTLVFCDLATGEPLRPNTISHVWVKIARIAKLKLIRLHDARHTFASIHLKRGTHPKIVQEMLGHANFSTTMDLYSHISPTMQEDAAKNFDDAFKIKDNKTKDENQTANK